MGCSCSSGTKQANASNLHPSKIEEKKNENIMKAPQPSGKIIIIDLIEQEKPFDPKMEEENFESEDDERENTFTRNQINKKHHK